MICTYLHSSVLIMIGWEVITALGWTYDNSFLHPSIKLAMSGPPWMKSQEQSVYPDLTSEYESTSAKDIFVAGAASHGLDRRSHPRYPYCPGECALTRV
jgi:hypothetical protein